MAKYRFHLDPVGRNKIACPNCNKAKRFSKYIDNKGEIEFPDNVGRCDRENNCGYHKTPKQHFEENDLDTPKNDFKHVVSHEPPPSDRIPSKYLESSQKGHERNDFCKWLRKVLAPEAYAYVVNQYRIGTTKDGSTVFWQIDTENQARTGQIIKYREDGHRTNQTTWVHSKLKNELPAPFHLDQCLFGLHLVWQYPSKPIAICEAPKTAVVASILLPQYNWLATCGSGGLSLQKITPICTKKIRLYPDTGKAFEDWQEKADQWRELGLNVEAVDFLESKNLPEGSDLVDWLEGWRKDPLQLTKKEPITNVSEKIENRGFIRDPEPSQSSVNQVIKKEPKTIKNTSEKLQEIGFEIEAVRSYKAGEELGHLVTWSRPEKEAERDTVLINKLEKWLDSDKETFELRGHSLNGHKPRVFSKFGKTAIEVDLSRLKNAPTSGAVYRASRWRAWSLLCASRFERRFLSINPN
jgi:hypothetical protein